MAGNAAAKEPADFDATWAHFEQSDWRTRVTHAVSWLTLKSLGCMDRPARPNTHSTHGGPGIPLS